MEDLIYYLCCEVRSLFLLDWPSKENKEVTLLRLCYSLLMSSTRTQVGGISFECCNLLFSRSDVVIKPNDALQNPIEFLMEEKSTDFFLHRVKNGSGGEINFELKDGSSFTSNNPTNRPSTPLREETMNVDYNKKNQKIKRSHRRSASDGWQYITTGLGLKLPRKNSNEENVEKKSSRMKEDKFIYVLLKTNMSFFVFDCDNMETPKLKLNTVFLREFALFLDTAKCVPVTQGKLLISSEVM